MNLQKCKRVHFRFIGGGLSWTTIWYIFINCIFKYLNLNIWMSLVQVQGQLFSSVNRLCQSCSRWSSRGINYVTLCHGCHLAWGVGSGELAGAVCINLHIQYCFVLEIIIICQLRLLAVIMIFDWSMIWGRIIWSEWCWRNQESWVLERLAVATRRWKVEGKWRDKKIGKK